MDSPDVKRLFSCFAESTGTYGETLKAFIFSLKNEKALPPFKCLAREKTNAIYKSSAYGPYFGRGLRVGKPTQGSLAWISTPYSVPEGVNNREKNHVLANTAEAFYPDNYEVFYLD